MPVFVRTEGLSTRPVAPAEVRARAERMLRALSLSKAELSVLLCDDAAIRVLNRDYRDIDRPTDVLAFPQAEGAGKPKGKTPVLGDVVISLPTAKRQAQKAGRTIVDEVTMLLAHGLLHLLGYDHRTRSEERIMMARTDALCAAAKAPRKRR